MVELKKTDLSKLSFAELVEELKAVFRGTPVGTIFRIVFGFIATLAFLVGILFWLENNVLKNASPSIAHKSETTKDSQLGPFDSREKSNGPESNSSEHSKDELIFSQTEKIKTLQAQINFLTEQINKQPDGYRCMIFDNDLKKLRENKLQIENNIQLLLRPPQTKEQAIAGIYYSTIELDVFVKQAAEYRKQAIDIQEQIKIIESSRADCKT